MKQSKLEQSRTICTIRPEQACPPNPGQHPICHGSSTHALRHPHVYSPLIRHPVSPNTGISIICIGVLGHFAIIIASALAATVTAISHSASKSADAISLGATSFTCTSYENWGVGNERSFVILWTKFLRRTIRLSGILVC